jgi:hypothetical protein
MTRVTDQFGRFELTGLAIGDDYRILVSLVGKEVYRSETIHLSAEHYLIHLDSIRLKSNTTELKSVSIVAKKPFFEQKADRMIVNVDAAPSSAGSSAMDILEKSPRVTVDKDGNISLKGKQGVLVYIDDKPTYMTATQLASYLKSLPASAIDLLEIMTNPSAKYDAAGNAGIINIKTRKNKAKGFNGNLTLTHSQGVYPKPGGSLNLNYKTGKFNFFFNGGYTYWEGFQNLAIVRDYLNQPGGQINSIFTQNTFIKFINPELNLKFGVDYYVSDKTTIGLVVRGFRNNETDQGQSTIYLRNADQTVDSIVSASSKINSLWKNGALNLNLRHKFDSAGTELTVDADYINYQSGSSQYFNDITYNPNWDELGQTILTGNLPSNINIFSFKTDFSHPFAHNLKLEAGFKSSYVTTDNIADYYDVINEISEVDTTKTNRFLYKENINAAYVNFNKQIKKWSVQAGLRLENTNYYGHQLGNPYTVINNDSSFSRTYFSLFPTLYISYQANAKNSFSVNFGRRIDRPSYQDLNPFLFFLDEFTYQAGNPYLQPQFTDNIELSHTYNNFLTTTLNYSYTDNFMTETFQQEGQATIVSQGNIGFRQNEGIAVSANIPVRKWWSAIVYTNLSYTRYKGVLYGEPIDLGAATLMANLNNQFHFEKGWSAELSGWARTRGVEGQVIVEPLGQAAAAISKQLMKDKASLKIAGRDLFYTGGPRGYIDFQDTEASFHNTRDSRQVSLTFTYRFGKPLKGAQANHNNNGGAGDEQSRVKSGGNN